jgi:hypothetical protein
MCQWLPYESYPKDPWFSLLIADRFGEGAITSYVYLCMVWHTLSQAGIELTTYLSPKALPQRFRDRCIKLEALYSNYGDYCFPGECLRSSLHLYSWCSTTTLLKAIDDGLIVFWCEFTVRLQRKTQEENLQKKVFHHSLLQFLLTIRSTANIKEAGINTFQVENFNVIFNL